MYKITQIIVKLKKNKELYDYLHNLCVNYTYLKNTANFHIRQHMTGLGKIKPDRYPNESESISLFRKYISLLNDNSIAYYNKRKNNIISNQELSAEEKESKLSAHKTPVTYELPTVDKWFLGYNVVEGVLRLSENENYTSLPAQVNQYAIKDVCNEWKSYFKALESYNAYPHKFTGKPKPPKYYEGDSTVKLTNIVCKLVKESRGTYLRFPKTECKLNLGRYIKDTVLKEVSVKCVADEIKVTLITEKEDIIIPKKDSCRVASIDIGGKNTVTLTNNVGLKPVIILGDILKDKNDRWLTAIDEAKSALRQGLDSKDYTKPFTSKKIKKMYHNRDKFLSDYFHKICLYIIRYCKKNDIDTLVIGRNKGMKQNSDMGSNNRDFHYIPFTKLYTYLSYLCDRNGINYIETEESYTSQASFFDRDEIPTVNTNFHDDCLCKSPQDLHSKNENLECVNGIKKDAYKAYNFSGKRTDRDTYVTQNGITVHADINGSLNIMRKVLPHLCGNIRIRDVMVYDTLSYEYFYPPYKLKVA